MKMLVASPEPTDFPYCLEKLEENIIAYKSDKTIVQKSTKTKQKLGGSIICIKFLSRNGKEKKNKTLHRILLVQHPFYVVYKHNILL